MTWVELLDLFAHLAMLSLLAVGGAMTIASDMNRFLVDERAWLSAAQFTDAIAIAQAAPGPNILFVTLLGWQAAGAMGALLATVGILTPASVLTYHASRWRSAQAHSRLMRAIRLGLSPIAVGFTLAAGVVIAEGAIRHGLLALLCAAAVWVSLATRLNPLWLIGAGALVGVLALP